RDHAKATGESLPVEEIARRAAAGDAAASASLDRHAGRLARGLASVINVVDPDAVVLGGGLSNLEWLYGELPGRLQDFVFSDVCTTPVVAAMHGDSSGVRGAAWLWRPEELSAALGSAGGGSGP
nr:ROK family protein [Kiloniellales bacterium]